MAQITRLKFSGSTDGKRIKVVATTTAGTTIHAAHATAIDEIYLNAHNSSTSDVKLTIEFGGTTSPDDTIEVTIPAESGLTQVIAGDGLTNSLLVRAFAASANVITIGGYVLRVA